jgi:hypothetical protein
MLLIWYAGLRRHARRLIGRLSAGVGLARALDLTSPYRPAACNGGLELPAQIRGQRGTRELLQGPPRRAGCDF